MKKDVGIMTFHRAQNYGSVLQAYALQQTILKLGKSCEIIDFSNERQKEMYLPFTKNDNIKHFVRNIITSFHLKTFKRHYNDFEEFLKNHLILSKDSYSTYDSLVGIEKNYNCLLAGSDQVWNIKCYDADDAYFLGFAKDVKKVAYAPSFGAKNLLTYADDIDKYKNYLQDFSNISIREKNGQKWLNELLGYDVPIYVDPSFLLTKSEWEKMIGEPMIKGKYILYYSFHYSTQISKTVKELSKKFGLPVYILSARAQYYYGGQALGFKLVEHSGPLEFLNAIKHATIIFTNSFHGAAFSTILHKKFYFLYGNVQNKDDDRATFLIEQLGIQECVVKMDELDRIVLEQTFDYDNAEKILKPLRDEAVKYLCDVL